MNPIIYRELCLVSRSPETYRLRAWAVGVGLMLMLLLLTLAQGAGISSEETGRNLLSFLGHAAFVFVLSVGGFSSSDCLSSERRMGTYGLLFLTRLKVWQVVLGKLASHSLTAIYGFVAIVPILGLPLLFGGVGLDQFVRLVIALLSCLMLSVCAGVLASSTRREASKAMMATLLVMVLPTLLLPCLGAIPVRGGGGGFGSYLSDFLGAIGPYNFVFNTLSGRDREFFGGSVFLYLVTSVLFFVVACLFSKGAINESFDSVGLEKQRDKSKTDRVVRVTLSSFQWLRRRRRSSLGDKILTGRNVLESHVSRCVPYLQLQWLFFGVYVLAFLVFLLQAQGNDIIEAGMALLPLHILLKMLVAIESFRRFNEEVRAGSLELICVTPQEVNDLPEQFFERIFLVFRNPMRILALLNLLTLIVFLGRTNTGGMAQITFACMLLGGVVLLFRDVPMFIWIGLSEALKPIGLRRVFLSVFLKYFALSWGVLVAVMVLFSLIVRDMAQVPSLVLLIWIVASFLAAGRVRLNTERLLCSRFRRREFCA